MTRLKFNIIFFTKVCNWSWGFRKYCVPTRKEALPDIEALLIRLMNKAKAGDIKTYNMKAKSKLNHEIMRMEKIILKEKEKSQVQNKERQSEGIKKGKELHQTFELFYPRMF